MRELGPDLIELLKYLLPGFLAGMFFHGLSRTPRGSEFDRIVEALVLNLPIQVLSSIERWLAVYAGRFRAFGVWSKNSDLAAATVTAVSLGLLLSRAVHGDRFHQFARKWKLTRETAYPSEWYGVFARRLPAYIILQFKDSKRLAGWPGLWPSDPHDGYFELKRASWLRTGTWKRVEGASVIVVSVRDVRWVEFMGPNDEETRVTETKIIAPTEKKGLNDVPPPKEDPILPTEQPPSPAESGK